ncbi:hypothetical protein [Streptomyces fragilis]|uniref:Ketohydroxyglutarate aldolase n=1 Tax=Streptomyces fragilis TaxID=67301 RepID=A0ABV2YC21_9ACTN|nr:hypothetical protein [Streptomyces fragilis]
MSEPDAPRTVGVVLAVDPDRFDEVVEALRRAGLRVTAEQPLLGSLSGTLSEDRLPALAAVDGVLAVDRDRTVTLPEPGSPLQ